MKKTIISILCAVILSGCENTVHEEKAEAIASVSSTVTTAEVASSEEKKTSETAVSATVTKGSSLSVSTTSSMPGTTVAVSTTAKSETAIKHTEESTTKAPPVKTQTSSAKAENKPVQTKKPTAITNVKQTDATSVSTTASATTTEKSLSAAQWNDTMKAWRKLCEGEVLNNPEWELVRQDIISYTLDKFNGKTIVDLNCGVDKYTRTFPNPLNLSVDESLADISHARMDSYCEAECSALINMAADETEIYEIARQMRAECLAVVDRGINNWYVFCKRYGELEYASDIPFNLYLDDTSIWFLTE